MIYNPFCYVYESEDEFSPPGLDCGHAKGPACAIKSAQHVRIAPDSGSRGGISSSLRREPLADMSARQRCRSRRIGDSHLYALSMSKDV